MTVKEKWRRLLLSTLRIIPICSMKIMQRHLMNDQWSKLCILSIDPSKNHFNFILLAVWFFFFQHQFYFLFQEIFNLFNRQFRLRYVIFCTFFQVSIRIAVAFNHIYFFYRNENLSLNMRFSMLPILSILSFLIAHQHEWDNLKKKNHDKTYYQSSRKKTSINAR